MGGSGSGLVTLIIVWAIGMLLSRLFRGQAGPPSRKGLPPRSPAEPGAGRWRRPAGRTYPPLEPYTVEDLRPREQRAARSTGRAPAGKTAPAGKAERADRPASGRRLRERDAAPVVEYLGSLGFESSEGVTIEGQVSALPGALDEHPGLASSASLPASTAVGWAVSLLRRPEGATEGAAAAIVLSEILGPPRALKPRRSPVAERMSPRAGRMPVGGAER